MERHVCSRAAAATAAAGICRALAVVFAHSDVGSPELAASARLASPRTCPSFRLFGHAWLGAPAKLVNRQPGAKLIARHSFEPLARFERAARRVVSRRRRRRRQVSRQISRGGPLKPRALAARPLERQPARRPAGWLDHRELARAVRAGRCCWRGGSATRRPAAN